jgi:hypothetical protein
MTPEDDYFLRDEPFEPEDETEPEQAERYLMAEIDRYVVAMAGGIDDE